LEFGRVAAVRVSEIVNKDKPAPRASIEKLGVDLLGIRE
jgi:hypothetical protein